MERLTEWSYLAGVMTGDLKVGVDERKAFNRLAAHEDTMPLELAQELAQAEKDGQLVVLNEPRKPLVWGDDTHDTILCPICNHDLIGGFQEDEYCEKDMYQCPYCGQSIDSTKAITLEKAEAALKKREADNEALR